jgi:hypothetical protein
MDGYPAFSGAGGLFALDGNLGKLVSNQTSRTGD